jgi:hypothetical protein
MNDAYDLASYNPLGTSLQQGLPAGHHRDKPLELPGFFGRHLASRASQEVAKSIMRDFNLAAARRIRWAVP